MFVERTCLRREGDGDWPELFLFPPSSLYPGAEEAGFSLTMGTQKTRLLSDFPPDACFPCLNLTRVHQKEFSLTIPLGRFQRVWLPGAMTTPMMAADWLRRSHPFVPFAPSPCRPLGAGSSAGDVLSNPTVREGKRESHLPLFWIHFNALMPWIFFFKEKVYIYIYIWVLGGREIFFSLVLIKWGVGVFKSHNPRLVP